MLVLVMGEFNLFDNFTTEPFHGPSSCIKWIYEPVDLMYFHPISSLYEKFYPRNINYIPVVKFFVCLDIEQKTY